VAPVEQVVHPQAHGIAVANSSIWTHGHRGSVQAAVRAVRHIAFVALASVGALGKNTYIESLRESTFYIYFN